MYYIISNSDGDTYVEEVTKVELLKRIQNDEYYSHTGYIKKLDEIDTNYWGGKLLIIKGNIVAPTPVEIISKWDIE